MTRSNIPDAAFIKVDLSRDLKLRFQAACQAASERREGTYSMARVTRMLIEAFCEDVEGGTEELAG
jgi:hypothetical protein